MSGLFALLDDVAAIAKVAAASVDDIGAAAGRAGAKAAGLVIDDVAVTPRYVQGISAARELPMIGRIALGSLRNKIVLLLPALLLLDAFLPASITPLLMIGGTWLCFEGAEKLFHVSQPESDAGEETPAYTDPTALEEARVAGVIRTDFILSAEIMTIALSIVDEPALWMTAAVLVVVALMVTAGVYGVVALIVKMDDVGLHLAREGRLAATRHLGRLMVRAMPVVLLALSAVGVVAMLWVGGSIVLHGLAVTGLWPWPHEAISALAGTVAALVSAAPGLAGWLVTATFDGLFGLALGGVAVLLVKRVGAPLWKMVRGGA